MTFAELKAANQLVVTDEVCEYCKAAKDRDTLYLIELPVYTKNLSIKVKVCAFCDGESLIEKAYRPRDEQKESDIS